MNLEIQSYSGIGPIKFGMSREEVRKVLNTSVKTFMKSPNSPMPTDSFADIHLHVYYDATGMTAVEIFPPANPVFMKYDLLKLPFSEAMVLFKSLDKNCEFDIYGLNSEQVGILYWHDLDDKTKPADAVICFKRDYYKD